MVRNFFNRNRRTEPPRPVAAQSTHSDLDQSEFGTLGQTLQQELQRLIAQANRLQIRCAIREGILLVLTEHLLHVEPDPQQTFVILEQSVRELTPRLLESDPTCSPTVHSRPLPVRLYLRVAGYQQPYAFHAFTLEPAPLPGSAPDVAPIAAWSGTEIPISEFTAPIPESVAPAAPIAPETPEIAPPVEAQPQAVSEAIVDAVVDEAHPNTTALETEQAIVPDPFVAEAEQTTNFDDAAPEFVTEPTESIDHFEPELEPNPIVAELNNQPIAEPEAPELEPGEPEALESVESFVESTTDASMVDVSAAAPIATPAFTITNVDTFIAETIDEFASAPAPPAPIGISEENAAEPVIVERDQSRDTQPIDEPALVVPEEDEAEPVTTETEQTENAPEFETASITAEPPIAESLANEQFSSQEVAAHAVEPAIEFAIEAPATPAIEPVEVSQIEPSDFAAEASTETSAIEPLETSVEAIAEPPDLTIAPVEGLVEPPDLTIESAVETEVDVEPIENSDIDAVDWSTPIVAPEDAPQIPPDFALGDSATPEASEQDISEQDISEQSITDSTTLELQPSEVFQDESSIHDAPISPGYIDVADDITDTAVEPSDVPDTSDTSDTLDTLDTLDIDDGTTPTLTDHTIPASEIDELPAPPEPIAIPSEPIAAEAFGFSASEHISAESIVEQIQPPISTTDDADYSDEPELLNLDTAIAPSTGTDTDTDTAPLTEQYDAIDIQLIPDDTPVIESADDFEYTAIADIETADSITDEAYQDIEQEAFGKYADEDFATDEVIVEPETETVERTEIEARSQDVAVQPEEVDYLIPDQLTLDVEETVDTSTTAFETSISDPTQYHSTVFETEIDSASVPAFDIDSLPDTRPASTLESTQEEIALSPETIEYTPDSQSDRSEYQNHPATLDHSTSESIASTEQFIDQEITSLDVDRHPGSVNQLGQSIERVEDNFAQLNQPNQPSQPIDQAEEHSSFNGNIPPRSVLSNASFKAVPTEIVSSTEDHIQPIRLIPAVQDSATSLDRLPLDLGDKKPFRSRLTLSNVLLTGAVGLFFVVSGAYVLTRPCTLGNSCQPLQQAQQLSERALATLQLNPSALEVVDAYDQLTQANQLLETIPVWSSSHESAQTLMAESSNKVTELSLVVQALNQANVAAKKSLSPPHPIQVWREVQWTWREAISLLEKVPTDSAVYALAQSKRSEYQSNLESINSRILVEQSALDRLEAVKKAAEVTDARSQIVNTIESWQQTSKSWQAILDQLKQVPQGTMAHEEAQRLTRLYQLKLEDADNRRSQEARSVESYNQAVAFADQATRLEQQGQWSQAIDAWRQAITTIKQVPEATTYYNQAQTLLNSYLASLNQSEQSVKQLTLAQTVEPQLESVCVGSYNLCTYTLTTEAIRVQITPEYDQIVVQALRSAQLGSGAAVRADAAVRVNQFLQSLTDISRTAQVPVELYSAAGVKLGTSNPNQSGFVAP